MLQVTDDIELDEREIEFRFIRSPGPGGQHVNRAATAVQLRFDLVRSSSLPAYVRQNLTKRAKNRINAKGVLVITANRFRSQDLNRKDALERLKNLIVESTRKKKVRRRTKPTNGSVKRRLESKKRRSQLKKARRPVSGNVN